MDFYITRPADYWIATNAVVLTLNALGHKDRIQASVASGAVIMCFVADIKPESAGGEPGYGDGLWYDANHEPKRWPLSVTPTKFDTQTRKYIYAAIPRSTSVGSTAVLVFPSQQLDIFGRVKHEEDGEETYEQVGSEDYFYVYLHGIISDSINRSERVMEQVADWGTLGTTQGNDEKLVEGEWYRWSNVTQTVTLLKKIVMEAGSHFMNIRLRDKELTGVATAATGEEFVDSETLVVTPSYLQNKFLSKKNDDEAEGEIGFLKGIWLGIKDKWTISNQGDATLHDINANDVQAASVQSDDVKSSDYTGETSADTGFRLFRTTNGHSKLIVDELFVRIKAVFESLEVKKEMVTGGNQVYSCAANVIARTDYYDANNQLLGYSTMRVPYMVKKMVLALPSSIARRLLGRYKTIRVNLPSTSGISYIRCYFLAEEGGRKVHNLWSVTGGHDLARCQTFNLDQSERESFVDGNNTKVGNVFWWRKVIAVSSSPVELDGKKYHYFDVSMSERWHDGALDSDLPCAGDEVSQWGNDANTDRMNLRVIEVTGSDAPADKWYRGIYTFDMNKCYFGGNPRKDMISAATGVEFYGPSFKIKTETGVAPVPHDINVDWAAQTKSRAEYAETGIAVGDLIVKNYYYDRVPHNGSLWLCTFDDTAYWARYAKYENGVITYVTEDVFNALSSDKQLYVKVADRTGLNDNQVCRRRPYTSAEPSSLSGDWLLQVEKGQNGVDAQDVEWAYIRTKTNVAPVILSDDTYTDSNGKNYTADEHLPHVTGNANIENNEGVYECTDDPKGVNETWKYEWEIKRTKGTATNGHRAWNYYQGAMTLHGNYAESAFIIDTDNDNDQFGTDSESVVLVTQTRQTVVALYDGSTQQPLTNLTALLTFDDGTSVPSGVATVSANASTGVVEVTVLQNSTPINHSEIQATITATCAKGSKQTTFSLRKVMGGAPGLNPIIYQLAPTVKAFPFARTSTNALTPNSQVSQINVSRTEGNTTTILTTAQTGITYQWGFDDSTTPEETNKSVGSTITVTKAQAALHQKVWIQLSTGDRETLPIVKDGAKGDPGNNGDTPVQAFQWNQSPTTAPSPLPSGATLGDWSRTAPNRPSGTGDYYLWMTQSVMHTAVDGTVTYDTWSAATRISGDKGTAGEDGTDYEYIYILKTAQYNFPTAEKPANISTGEVSPGSHAASGSDTNKQQDDWVPNGWWDNPQGIDATNKFEYMSLRVKPKGSDTWGAFSEPFIWSHWGRNGMDGDGTEYVFIRTTNNVPPVMDSTQSGYTADEFRPTITAASQAASGTEQAQTTDDPRGTDETYKYEWVAKRNMTAPDASGQRTWKKFTGENNDYKMSLWGNYAESAPYYVIDYGRASSRSLSGGTPSGFDTTTGWVATQPYPSSTYPYIWQRSRLYNPNTGAYGTATYVCITGADGPQGDDGAGGVDITTDPTVILIRQIAKPVGNNTTDFGLPMDIGFSAREGSTAGTVTSISIPTPGVGVAVQRKDGEISKAQITAVVPSNNTYPTKGYFYAVVNYTVNNVTKSVQVKVSVYIDLIGEIVTTIEGDVETTVAHDIGYAIDPSGSVQSLAQVGTFIRSSAENTSKLEKIVAAANLLPSSGFTNLLGKISSYFDEDQQSFASGVYSPCLVLAAGTYCLSVFATGNPNCSRRVLAVSGHTKPARPSAVTTSETGINMNAVVPAETYDGMTRYRGAFTLAEKSFVFIKIAPPPTAGGNAAHAQLEQVTASTDNPTPWEMGAKYYTSEIKQTATEYDNSIRDDLGEVGINLSGATKTFTATANHFKIQNSAKTKTTFSVDSDGNIIGGGDAFFKGTVKAENFYHRVALVSGVSIAQGYEALLINDNGGADKWMGFINDVTVSGITFSAGKYYNSSDYDPRVINDLMSDYPSDWKWCTAYADEILVVDDSSTGGTVTPIVVIPRCQDVPGKMITIRHTSNHATHDATIQQVDRGLVTYTTNPFSNGVYVSGGTVHISTAPTQYITLRLGYEMVLQSIGTAWVVTSNR